MKTQLLSLIAIMILVSTAGFAQSGQPGKTCATMEVFERQLKENPGLERRMEAIERFTKEVTSKVNNGNGKGKPTPETESTDDIIKIPVVFHVVYNTPAQNVSDEMINEQLRVLNEDFRKKNADISNLPSLFSGVDADSKIKFTLAGITRTYTTITSFSSNDAVKYTSRGGQDAWDASKYMNFWVCNLNSGLLGYAQFPGGNPATDGVVCLYSSLPGGTSVNYNLGRTATHEVGHWLNLRHIWGDRYCGDDYVDDTPTQLTYNWGCPNFPRPTCNNTSDMFMNYMDYTDDKCMYMFTYGQKDRMRAIFAPGGPRATFAGSKTGAFAEATSSSSANLSSDVTATLTSEVLAYPNPANTEATFSITIAERSPVVSLQVLDVRGKVVHSMLWSDVAGTFEHTVSLEKIARGIYFVSVQSGNSTAVTKLSVVK